MKLDGSCHCGYITFEAEADPDKVGICHCTDCQTISGTAFRTVVLVMSDKLRWLSGEPKVYVKTADNGTRRPQGFCPRCGTPIYSTSEGDGPKAYGIRVGCLRQRHQLVPKFQGWARSKQSWVNDIASIPSMETQSDAMIGRSPPR